MPLLLIAIILGIVEGVTEFLPVSSTGHLILATELLGFDADEWAYFNVIIQLGAILAIVVLYWRTFWAVLEGLLRREPDVAGASSATCLIAFLPAAVLGFILIKHIEALAWEREGRGHCADRRRRRDPGHRKNSQASGYGRCCRNACENGARCGDRAVPGDDSRRQPLGSDDHGRAVDGRRTAHRRRVQLLPRRSDDARSRPRSRWSNIGTRSRRARVSASI